MKPLIAVQLYTLRDLTSTDMAGTLEQVAQIGYDGVELAGYGNLSHAELVAALSKSNLRVVGAHIALQQLQDNLPQVIEEQRALGNTHIVCPFIGPELRGTLENYKSLSATLNDIGAKLKAEGMQLCYHNHAFEFEDRFDLPDGSGIFGLDAIFENSDPQLVQAEVDTYWVQKAGVDPAAYLKKYAGRIPLVHLKDMREDGFFAPVGTGTMDFTAICAASEAGGAQAFIVEQDKCDGDPMASVQTSFENLRAMGKTT